jgi:hypothetical protein
VPSGDESLIRRGLILVALVALAGGSAAAQQQPVVAAPPAQPDFFTRTDFHLNAAWLANVAADATAAEETLADQRFRWDTFWGGSVDVVDYVSGRLGVLIDYEAVLGSEFQPFDPNQGSYTLEASASARVHRDTELVAIFHHVSRHLSDRPKVRNPVAFNELGLRVLRRLDRGRSTLDVDAEGGRVMERAYVDYAWLADLSVTGRFRLSNRFGVFAHATGHLIGVDGDVANRTTQSGGLIEAGVHIAGTGGALELFAGLEKRIDADPLDRQPRHWALAGFRLLSR